MTTITWIAVYKDDTALTQHENDGTEHSTEEIDRKKLAAIVLLRDNVQFLVQAFEPGQRLIFRRRVSIEQTGGEDVKRYLYMLGWQQTVNGKNVQHVAYIDEDTGFVTMAGKFNDKHPLFYTPIPVPADELCVE